MSYPEAIHLPLNARALGDSFSPVAPAGPDPGEPGYVMVFRAGSLVLQGPPGAESPLLEDLPDGWLRPGDGTVIGRWRGRPLRVTDAPAARELPSALRAAPFLMLLLEERLSDELATLAGRAQQVLSWERASRACHTCGGATTRIPRTWGSRCGACHGEQFPPIYPCAIVLVRRADEFLLIHKSEWPDGMYSLPSGFCDLGECLEECARREVREETGVEIDNLRYAGSQSWPFPSQLMIAFTADYAGGRLAADQDEVAHAAWFPRDALPYTVSSKCIAGWLIETQRG